MNWKLMFKGEYVAAVEMGDKRPTMTIREVKICKLEQEDGRQKDKGIIMFREIDRGWVLNRTNATCLAAMFGDDTNDWLGKRVTLFSTPVQVGKKKEPGIRVYGSPDIASPRQVEIRLPRKKPFMMTMHKTGAQATPRPSPAPAPPPEPEQHADADPFADVPPPDFDPMTGEVLA